MIITHVKKARNDYNKNGVIIKKGESYWWIQDRFKEKMYFKKKPSEFEIAKYQNSSMTRYWFKKRNLICEIDAALWKRNIEELKNIHRYVDVNRKRNKERNPYADRFLGFSPQKGAYLYFERRGEFKVKVKERIPSVESGKYYTIRKYYVSGKSIPFLWDLLNHMKYQPNGKR